MSTPVYQSGFNPPTAQGIRVQYSDAPMFKPGDSKPRLPLSKQVLSLGGLAVLICTVALPAADASFLLHDFNYVFWAGSTLPLATLLALSAIAIVYLVYTASWAAKGTDFIRFSDLSSLISTFLCLLGVTLVLTSLSLYWSGYHITTAITYNCAGSTMTRDVRQSYMNLLTLRQTPQCASKFSIEECNGFAAAAPATYLDYFKSLETDFRCSGFCYTGPSNTVEAASAGSAGPQNATLAEASGSSFLSRVAVTEKIDATLNAQRLHRAAYTPPALFSTATFKTSCDGAAVRNLEFMAIGTSHVWWATALALIGISAIVGFGEWLCCAPSLKRSS